MDSLRKFQKVIDPDFDLNEVVSSSRVRVCVCVCTCVYIYVSA